MGQYGQAQVWRVWTLWSVRRLHLHITQRLMDGDTHTTTALTLEHMEQLHKKPGLFCVCLWSFNLGHYLALVSTSLMNQLTLLCSTG